MAKNGIDLGDLAGALGGILGGKTNPATKAPAGKVGGKTVTRAGGASKPSGKTATNQNPLSIDGQVGPILDMVKNQILKGKQAGGQGLDIRDLSQKLDGVIRLLKGVGILGDKSKISGLMDQALDLQSQLKKMQK